MKVFVSALLIGLTFIISPAGAIASDPPVILTHTITGYSAAGKMAVIDISVHVTNPGNAPLSNLTLSFVPLPPFVKGGITLNVATLGPHQSADIPLQVTSSAFLNRDGIARRPLLWAGKYIDAHGMPVEFPVMSHPGGVK